MGSLVLNLAVLVYFASGITLTLYNKFLVSPAHWGFSFPITLILAHMITNFSFSALTVRCAKQDSNMRGSPFHPSHISRSVFLRRFVPIGLLFGGDITLTNVSFRFVSVTLTEVVKSSVPALLFISNLVRGTDHTRTTGLRIAKCANVVLICAGMACTAAGEADFEIRGFLAAVGATIAATIKLIMIEHLLLEETENVTSVVPSDDRSENRNGADSEIAMAPLSQLDTSSPMAVGNGGGPASSSSSAKSNSSHGRNSSNGPVSPRQLLVSPSRPDSLSLSSLTPSLSMDELAAMNAQQQSSGVMRRGSTPNHASAASANGGAGGGDGGVGRLLLMPKAIQLPADVTNGGTPIGNGTQSSSYAKLNLSDEDEEMERRRRMPLGTPQHRVPQLHVMSSPRMSPATRRSLNSSPATPSAPDPALSFAASAVGAAMPDTPARGSRHGDDGAVTTHRLHPILSLFYFAPVSALALIPMQAWLEFQPLQASKFVESPHWEPTLAFVIGGGLLAFALNASELFVIRETSALTLCIFGVAKFMLVVALSQGLGLQRPFSHLNLLGLALTVVGLIVYNGVKYIESKQAAEEATQGAMMEADEPVLELELDEMMMEAEAESSGLTNHTAADKSSGGGVGGNGNGSTRNRALTPSGTDVACGADPARGRLGVRVRDVLAADDVLELDADEAEGSHLHAAATDDSIDLKLLSAAALSPPHHVHTQHSKMKMRSSSNSELMERTERT